MGKTNDTAMTKVTENERREKRRAANRKSARKSRYREMVMLDELQRSTRDLTAKNSALVQENQSLKGLIALLKNRYAMAPMAARVVSFLSLRKPCEYSTWSNLFP